MTYERFIEDVVRVVETVGVSVMVLGGLGALVRAGVATVRPTSSTAASSASTPGRDGVYEALRRHLGRAILLGLEILIVGDIVRTIVVDPTLESVAVLGLIVLIRIVLSFSLEVEMDGSWPWSRWRRDPARGDAS